MRPLHQRGGQPEREVAHGKYLAGRDVETIWGWNTTAGRHRARARVDWLTRACGLAAGKTVLECGCGTGIFTRGLAETGADITAVDISEDLLVKARERCGAPNVTFARCNLEDPEELREECFDAMVGVSVLHHLDVAKALPALLGKLKPGAQVAFSEPNLMNPINKYVIFTDDLERRRRLGVSPTEMAFYPKELRGAFESAGYFVHSVKHRDFLHPRVPGLMIPLAKGGQFLAERVPLIRRWSGSLWVHAERPRAEGC